LNEAAGRMGRRQRVLVRVAPKKVPRGFGVNMAGKPCQFGIDEEDLGPALEEIKALPHLRLSGFHIYSGTQCLKPDALIENYEIFIDIFQRFAAAHDITPEKLIFGSGIGIPYLDGEHSVDLAPIAERINPLLDALRSQPRFARATLLLETGRYLIGEAGIYLTRVVNRKQSRGSQICTFDGGMNHHLGACGHLGMVLHRNYQMFKVSSSCPDTEEQAYDLYGPLCTSIDTLGRGVKFPGLDVGDVIGVRCSGAYGITASPLNFISHPPPKEILVETLDGKTVVEDVSASRTSVLQLQ
jgi:diaminopimelate decarboxylase